MSAAQVGARLVVDCDVHCPVPSPEDLAPFLSKHWNDYLREVGYRQLVGVNYTYPTWSEMLSPPRGESAEPLVAEIFSRADVAILNVYYGLESQQHPYLVEALSTAVNQWLCERWLSTDERFLGSVAVAPQHAETAAEEIRRAAADGRFAAVLLPARSWEPYGSQRFWPIWEAAAETGLTPVITYGGSLGTPSTPNGWTRSLFEEYAGFQQVFAAHISSLIANGVFNRFPELKVVIMESGWTWLPALAWRMDAEWKAIRREVPWVIAPPSEYIRRHVRLTTQPIDAAPDPKSIRLAIEHLGDDRMLMYGSDFPREYEPGIELLLSSITERQAERVMSQNAVDTYWQLELHLAASGRPEVAMEDLRFDDRVAVVTGAGRGLGRAYALLLAERGARVVVNDLGATLGGHGEDSGPAAEVVAEIEAAGGVAMASTDSVATTEGAEALVARALAEFGQIDILINNAGIVVYRRFPEVDLAEYRRHLDVHLLGAFNVTRAAWPSMARRGYGRVVMTTSSAIFGAPELISYASAKAGVVGLGRSLATAGVADGIKVNIVSPLAVTRMWTESEPGASASDDEDPEQGLPAIQSSPEQVAPLVAFLCHESCPVTGEIYRSAMGRASRIFIAETEGSFSPTAESVRDDFAKINDEHGYFVPADSPGLNARAMEIADRRRQ